MVGFGDPLAKDSGHPTVDVVHDERRSPEVSHDVLEQQLDGRGLARVARVSAHAVRLLQVLQNRLVGGSGCDGDMHAAPGE
jgi:hypothetical protein